MGRTSAPQIIRGVVWDVFRQLCVNPGISWCQRRDLVVRTVGGPADSISYFRCISMYFQWISLLFARPGRTSRPRVDLRGGHRQNDLAPPLIRLCRANLSHVYRQHSLGFDSPSIGSRQGRPSGRLKIIFKTSFFFLKTLLLTLISIIGLETI